MEYLLANSVETYGQAESTSLREKAESGFQVPGTTLAAVLYAQTFGMTVTCQMLELLELHVENTLLQLRLHVTFCQRTESIKT